MSSLGDRIIGASARFEEAFQHRVGRPLGLRRSHYAVLRLVHEHPGITSGEIARDLNVTRPCISPVVDDLEKRGLLTRTAAPRDRRAQCLGTTASGAELVQKAIELALETERTLLSGWSTDERHRLDQLIERLASVRPVSVTPR
jgi:DNA-binding MarR family transcriptional regulator